MEDRRSEPSPISYLPSSKLMGRGHSWTSDDGKPYPDSICFAIQCFAVSGNCCTRCSARRRTERPGRSRSPFQLRKRLQRPTISTERIEQNLHEQPTRSLPKSACSILLEGVFKPHDRQSLFHET